MPLDYSFLDQCVAWPVSPPGHPASQVVPANAPYPDIPALILSGELDNITTLADGEAVAKAFKHGRQIRLANSFHVNALPRARSPCGAAIARRFIATLDPGDVGCAAEVAPVRLVPRFARTVTQLDPAHGLNGNSADGLSLQMVSAAVLAAGDVLARSSGASSGPWPGIARRQFPHYASRPIGEDHAARAAVDRGYGRIRNHRRSRRMEPGPCGRTLRSPGQRPERAALDSLARRRAGAASADSRQHRRYRGGRARLRFPETQRAPCR